jgi:hypothetical protein
MFYQRGYRSLVWAVLILLGIPLFYFVVQYGVGYVSGPTLWEGDRLETKTCRECGGSGKNTLEFDIPQIGDRCAFCRGTGTVDVIFPGPDRPTRLWGAVVNLPATGGEYLYWNPPNVRMLPFQAAMMPAEMGAIRGALGGVPLTFTSSGGETVEVRSNSTGRFSVRLPPGNHTVSVSRPGSEPFEGILRIEPLTEPVWLEHATVQGACSGGELASSYGLSCLVGLVPVGERGAFVRVQPLAPGL